MEEEKKTKIDKKIIIGVVALAAVAIAGFAVFFTKSNNDEPEEPNKPYIPNDVKVDDFSLSFLKLEENKENIIYSPLSIKYALNMLNDGANGKTKEEITKVIGTELPTKYENIEKVLSLANSVFIREEYISTIKDKYNAELIYDKFEDAKNVNSWIENKTFNIIKNMLKDNEVQNPNLEMILINALAIDMEWLDSFDAANTSSRSFYKDGQEEIKVAMMHKSSESLNDKYYRDDNYYAVSLPLKEYDGTSLEFVAIMPTEEDLHSFIVSDSFDSKVSTILGGLHSITENQELSISIPRFEFDYNLNFVDDLKKLGINDAFDDMSADFSNMSKKELVVGDAKHKADIKFSEKGIKAAAVTVIMMFDKSAMLEEKEIIHLNFDKPFMFIIRDSKTNEVWFTGAVNNPTTWDKVKEDYKYK